MKILVIGQEPRTHSLLEGLLASPLWKITHCATSEEASRELAAASPPYDYILIEPDEDAGVEEQLIRCTDERQSKAPVVYLNWLGTEMPNRRGDGIYGFYPISTDTSGNDGTSEDQWVFEYHAPCRKRSAH